MELVDLVLRFGEQEGSQVVLNRQGSQSLLYELKRLTKQVEEIQKKGGLTVIVSDEAAITCYRVDSYRRAAAS